MKKAIALLFAVAALAVSGTSLSQSQPELDLSQPAKGKVLLSIRGDIQVHNHNADTLELDRDTLQRLPRTSFTTHTPWTVGASTFAGVTVRDLLAAIGAGSQRFKAIAIDDYLITVEGVDFDRYPILIAYELDEKPMTLRDLGPLWLMFPFDDHPELSTEINKAFSVWQLREMEIL
jgi:hypothetical protein